MATDLLALRNAKQHVESYSREYDGLAQHWEAMDSRNCEAFLQMGIDAFEWLVRADRVVRMAIYSGETSFDADSDTVLRELCKRWLVPCAFAEKWIEIQGERGYQIDNLSDFRRCTEEMLAIVEANEGGEDTLSESMSRLRDSAVAEHRNGQTAEFIPIAESDLSKLPKAV